MNPPFSILFEDNHLLIINKPAGLLTQPSGTMNHSAEELAKNWIKYVKQKPRNVFLEAVHRLDKPVGGIVIFAKTSKSLSRLNEAMRNKETKKNYLALIEGHLPQNEGVSEHYLVHDHLHARVSSSADPLAKLARLHYRFLRRVGGYDLIEIELDTGRYHQIRAQMAAMGCPIVGDAKYGSGRSYSDEGIALHHARLEFPHPITKARLVIEAPFYFDGSCVGVMGGIVLIN